MDPMMIGGLMSGASGILNALKPATPVAPSQRADGYAMGGMSDGTSSGGSTGGSTGGAYGGAWSQANVDGSNWVVNMGSGTALGGGKSGGNGGVSPLQTMTGSGGVTPQSPFSFASPIAAQGSRDGGMFMMLGLGLLAYLLFAKR